MLRTILAILLCGMIGAEALAADKAETPDQIANDALRQSVGAPARVDIDDQATERLSDTMLFVPADAGARLLTDTNKPVPSGFKALLLGTEGMNSPGIIRFVANGYIDSDAALAWTSDDFLSSLQDTVTRANADRVKQNQPEREARNWVQAPRYNPEMHQISWSALILPKTAPRGSDGEITYHAIGFGRDGYVELTMATSLEKADEIGRMASEFLAGLTFRPGKTYRDALPTDKRAPAGLAGAMQVDALHKARSDANFWASDAVVPIAGVTVATVGAVSLLIYIRRHLRRESRRV